MWPHYISYLVGLERFGGGESTAISESPAASSFLTVFVGGGSSGAGAGGLGLCLRLMAVGLKISGVLLRGSTFGSSSLLETGVSSSDLSDLSDTSSLLRLLVV